jgi:HTH-type transcriptional regulator / antitoxin HigA
MVDDIRPVRSEADYQDALKELERLWGSSLGTPEGDRLDVLATLIDAFGTHSRIAEVLNRKRGLSIVMIRVCTTGWGFLPTCSSRPSGTGAR